MAGRQYRMLPWIYKGLTTPILKNFTMFEEAVEYNELNQFLRLVRTRSFKDTTV